VKQRFETFQEFWPFYLAEHSQKATRVFHFLGSSLLLILLTRAITLHSPISFICGIISAYGLAWISHFFIERNRPATFRYPLFSLMGDFKMCAFMISGKMENEIKRMKVRSA